MGRRIKGRWSDPLEREADPGVVVVASLNVGWLLRPGWAVVVQAFARRAFSRVLVDDPLNPLLLKQTCQRLIH